MPADATEIFNTLQGRWRLNRTITGFGTMAGEATFRHTNQNTLHYHEDVDVAPDGQPMHHAFRDYIFQLHDGVIDVRFADGRPFHRLVFENASRATGHHDCAPDIYDALYAFEKPDTFTIRWTVKGPRKDYISDTQYERLIPA